MPILNKAPTARQRIPLLVLALASLSVAAYWYAQKPASGPKGPSAVPIISAEVATIDLPLRFTASGTTTAVQTVDIYAQNTARIQTVHIKEGQYVEAGQRLFTLDARAEEAELNRANAEVMKDRADLDNAERNLARQKQLFAQEYISRSELDTAQTLVEQLRSQLAANLAAVEAARVARSHDDIVAPIAGRTGAITVYPGSLAQSGTTVLVNITQIDPIHVSFTLPEQQLADVQQAFKRGKVPVTVQPDLSGEPPIRGQLVFIDNTVDSASGSIRLKAEFPNSGNRLWPGMFVSVTLEPSVLQGALTVPAQAVQIGPSQQFVYVIDAENTVSDVPVQVRLIQDGLAVIEGVKAGTRIVAEGAQNLRPGSKVSEQQPAPSQGEAPAKAAAQ